MKRKMRYNLPQPSGGGVVNCKKKTSRVAAEGGGDNPVEVDSENLVRRYLKHSPDEKMKGVVTSCASLEDIYSATEKRNRPLVLGEASYDFCAICDDAKPHGGLWRGDHCRHRCCEACLKEYVTGKVKEDIHKIKCPETKCKNNLDKEFWEEIILLANSEELVEAWVDAKRQAEVLANPWPIKCPFKDCRQTFMDNGKGFLIRACPNCWRIFCIECKVKWHLGITCKDYNNQVL